MAKRRVGSGGGTPNSLRLKTDGVGKSKRKEKVLPSRKKRRMPKIHAERRQRLLESELSKIEAKQKKKRNVLALGPAFAEAMLFREDEEEQKGGNRKDVTKESVTKHRQRQRVLQDESEQVRNVMQHPAFKSNPIEALKQHLMNTVSNNPSEIAPALKPGEPGAPKRRKKSDEVKTEGSGSSGGGGGISMPDKEVLEKIREEARERVAKKKEEKSEMLRAVEKMRKKKQSGKIEKQSMKSLLGRKRGRIGEKRPKII